MGGGRAGNSGERREREKVRGGKEGEGGREDVRGGVRGRGRERGGERERTIASYRM